MVGVTAAGSVDTIESDTQTECNAHSDQKFP